MRAIAPDEERMNAATHALGLAGALVAVVVLLRAVVLNGGPWQALGCGIYAVTLVAAYAASMLSHAVQGPAAQHAMRVLDQSFIFLFIAGSYTPIALTWLRDGPGWWALHAAIWGVAAAGFVSKIAFGYRVRPGTVSPALYVLLSWLPVLATQPLMNVLPGRLLLWMLAGGVCYTAGVFFFHFDERVPYFHAAWHTLVVAGSACHYAGILFYCTAPVV